MEPPAMPANSSFRPSMAVSARLMAPRSTPPKPPPAFAFSMLGGMKSSIGCWRAMIPVPLFRRLLGAGAPFGAGMLLDAAAAAGAEIAIGADIRPGMLDHRGD